jgi:hypothetical protein
LFLCSHGRLFHLIFIDIILCKVSVGNATDALRNIVCFLHIDVKLWRPRYSF